MAKVVNDQRPGQLKDGEVHPSDAPSVLLRTTALTKDYPGIRALDSVDFDLKTGEVHVLFGENGAGKSTLISMLAGANAPTSGAISFKGEQVHLGSVHEARHLGISAVFQEFSLIPQMSVAENLFLGAEHTSYGFLQNGKLHRDAEAILQDLDFNLPTRARIDHLTRAEQQMVEIAKAFRSELSVLILDEPTASLTNHETDQLFELINKLKSKGVGIIYITHRMSEIRRIGDRITVLRDGTYIDTVDAKTTSENDLVQLMTGRDVGQIFPTIDYRPGDTMLDVQNLATHDDSLKGVSAHVRRGEVVGFAGLVGSGKSKFARACFGDVDIARGVVSMKGEVIDKPTPRDMLERGFMYLPSDRRTDGLMLMRAARENMSIASLDTPLFTKGWFLNKQHETRFTGELAERLNLTPHRLERGAGLFSGGNQQKLMLARCLTRELDLVVFDEPTVGVDVGTRAAIYEFIAELCEAGAAILLISSDLPEILHLSHRAYVFYNGQIQAEFAQNEITEQNILAHFFEKEAA